MSKVASGLRKRDKKCEPLNVIRSIVGWGAAGLGAMCTLALVLGMIDVIPDMQSTILHQSRFRWLAEGAIGGLMIAAIAFWRFQ